MEDLMNQVAGRVVLITGGNAGIGRAAAIEFAKQGAKVVVSGRREREGQEVVAGIKATTSWPSLSRRPLTTTFAPCLANSIAAARPIPAVPPVFLLAVREGQQPSAFVRG